MTDELLKLNGKELLRNERVMKAYKNLLNVELTHDIRHGSVASICKHCHNPTHALQEECDIPGAIETVAFQMRDACVSLDISGTPCDWLDWLSRLLGHTTIGCVLLAEPEDFVRAAVKAWEDSQK